METARSSTDGEHRARVCTYKKDLLHQTSRRGQSVVGRGSTCTTAAVNTTATAAATTTTTTQGGTGVRVGAGRHLTRQRNQRHGRVLLKGVQEQCRVVGASDCGRVPLELAQCHRLAQQGPAVGTGAGQPCGTHSGGRGGRGGRGGGRDEVQRQQHRCGTTACPLNVIVREIANSNSVHTPHE